MYLTKRGLVLRALNNYGLPHALRMTIGTEEANRLVADGLREFMALQMSAAPLISTAIALIGFGLIGGSIARAARAQGLVGEIVTTARSAENARAGRSNSVSSMPWSWKPMPRPLKDADLVILCIPVGACGPVAQEIAPSSLKSGAIVSDVGSVKGAVVQGHGRRICLPSIHFVPAHPVAGTEHSGPDSGFAELFINRWCILTPPEGTDPAATERLRAFWGRHGRQGRDHDARSS